ncbi:MAG: lytic transglycosylase domain-containing protein [Saprospiraceae bacterium]|nr:lytic transglycosylase domain-containing protein [Saprospiraceae bacterium]MBK8485263.1 lytic transglycosylase domain-containing protein [Saprospiraceae bacterium]MBK9222479.1 lytic transglycosylase domain-containing protein [Saprospiraceae bacterium]MBK9720486.1 lytic transglycosylase domain-containing protein [Saprospiraceae bacterium]MBK9727457.1 lytic transglycosylase domain-containing protein [Saprospiraceae bacterium]
MKVFLVSFGICLGAMAVFVLNFSGDLPFNNRYDPLPQTIHAVKLADSYDFAGEAIPMDYFDITERLERELLLNTYQHSSTILHLKLAMRFFPLFEKVFKEQGVPDDMKYLAVAESSLRNAVSSAGAKGMWQFKEEAAKELDLDINAFVDERNNPEKATLAACKYLKKQKERFGNWTLAAAAYNMGPTALQRALNEQKETNYFDLNLSEETNRYVFRIIAIKEIMKNPEKFGFYIRKNEFYSELNNYKTLEIDTSISNLADFAHQQNITYRQLKLFNPWLLKSELIVPVGKKYIIKIPK